MSDDRPDLDEYFIQIAKDVATRATCPRKKVGAIVVKNSQIISSGYNGAPKEMEHCTDVGCMVVNNHCERVVHAELNALLQAGKEAKDATLYSTVLPCTICLKACIQVGIKRIVYLEDYNKEQMILWLESGLITTHKLKEENG